MNNKIPGEIKNLIASMFQKHVKIHPYAAKRYEGEKGFDEWVDMLREDMWNLHGRVERDCENLNKQLEMHAEFYEISIKDMYKLYVHFNKGVVYKGTKIKQSFKNKGILYNGVLDCEREKNHVYYINNLHPDTALLLYHGTDETTVKCALNQGFDLNVPPRSRQKYPEVYIGGPSYGKTYRKGGIYVSPFKRTSGGFGSIIVGIVKQARHLYAPNWEMQESLDKGYDIDEKYLELYKDKYTNSFRPSVSYWLLASEAQALLKQSVKPDEILYVWWYDSKNKVSKVSPAKKYKEMLEK